MKMMKLLIPALAITAWAHTALATLTTPIYEIRACDVNGAAVTEPVASSTTPLKGGDTVRFVIRTLNPEFDTLGGGATTHWQLNYIGLGTAAADMISAPPGVGVVVNGQTRMAKYVKATYPTAYPFYTDFIFEYEVQPGDIALPIRLAADINGNAAGTGTGVYWFNSDLWEISKVGDPTVKVSSLKFASTAQIAIADSLGQPDGLPANSDNWDGYVCGFYAQTVGFAEQSATYEGVAYWSVVNQGSTTCTPIPTISVTGDPTAASKLYIWSGDDTIAEVVAGNDIVDVKTVASMPDQTGTGYLTNVKVGEIKVVKGQSDYKFKVQGKAGQKGKKVKLYLSENPNGFFKQASGDVTDYIEVEIIVGDSLVPNISLAGPTSVTVGTDYENAIGTITLTVSEPLPTTEPDNLVVTLTPSLVTAATVSDYVHMDYKNDGSSWATLPPYSFTLKKGETSGLTHTLYLFGLGADTLNTATAANPVNFDVTVTEETSGADVTTSCYYKMPSTLPVRFVPQKPALSADSLAVSAIGNIDRSFEIKIADNYKNLNDTTGYSIEYKKDISESDWTAMSNKWKRDSVTGILVRSDDASKLPVIKFTAGTYTTQFRVVTPAGDVKSDPITFTVTASAPAQSQAYYIDSSNTWQVTGTVTEGDTTPVTVGVRLTKANDTGDTIYAFLKPSETLPDATHNTKVRSKGTMFTTDDNPVGMPILNGETESDPGTLYVLDGSAGETLCYTVVLSSDQNDPKKEVPGYESKTFKLNALNAVPTIKQVKMGGVKVTESGKTFAGAVPQGATRTFNLVVNDTKADRTATGTDQFEYTWVVEEEGGLTLDPGGYGTITGDPNLAAASFTYTFQLTGTAKITLNLKDKDMSDYGEDFVFYVKVGSQPNVSVVNVDGINFFDETTIGPNNARMRVILSEPASVPLTIQLTVKSTHANPGILELGGATLTSAAGVYPATYDITIPANTTTKDFYLKNLDGTLGSSLEGWTIEGEVTTATASLKDPTKTWAQYYLHGEYYCTVDNVEPTFNCSLGEENTVSNAIAAAIGNGAAITFSCNDIKADLDAGVTVTWWSTDIGTRVGDVYPITSGDAGIKSYTPKFTSAGIKTVKVTVADKDADSGVGSFTRQWYYDVAASKTLSTLAHGPSAGTSTSALSQHYTSATGLGSGHVWADGTFAGAGGFKIDWNMGTRNVANFYGYGYKPGNTGVGVLDDGNIAGERDIPIDINGDNNTEDGTVASFIASGATPYTSTITDKDSFLYTWLVTTASDGGGMVSQICGSVSPERNGLAAAVGQIALPTAKTDDGTYVETMLEAIFAKEWRTTDNCGDINLDGIPDVAVMQYGFGVYEDGTIDTTKDLADLSTYNEDEDYLPTHLNPDEWAIPKLSNTWATAVNAFNAKLEIRGYGPGLNNNTTDMTGVTAGVGLNDITSEKDWEPVEWESWNSLGRPLTWSPERPTDPTKADTDDDGLPDGYEYYYWYKSFVGYYDKNNKFQRLTGRKLVLAHPEDDGELITWEDIAKAFDPLLPGDTKADLRDIDNDGLSDYEEYVLGSSPIEWDTDGDGLSDFWEVHLAPSLLPYKRSTNDSTPDGLRNDDNDYMAQVSTNYMYVTTTIDPSNGRTVYYATQTDDSYSTALNGTVACIRFDIGSTKYAYVGSDVTTAAALITGVDTDGDLADDKWFLAIDVPLKDCYRLDSAGVVVDAAEFCKGTEVKDAGDDNPATALYDYYVYTGTASAAGTFDQDRSYLVWQYGRPGAYRASYKAMGREMNIPTTHPVVAHGATSEVVLLNHWQVYQWNGFHLDPLKDMGTGFSPTTAWMQNSAGYVGTRWQDPSELGGSHLDRMGGKFGNYSGVGRAMDTVGFCALDEFLVDAFFRYATGTAPQEPSITGVPISFLAYYNRYTTLPQDITTDDGTTYGADSDGDGVPDGWELYVQCGPGNVDTKTYKYQGRFEYSGASLVKFGINASAAPLGPRHKPGNWDSTKTVSMDPIAGNAVDDNLNEREEFYGTDSTAAYSGVPTIAEVTPFNARWRNKFWPTDPWSSDTDCDGISDGAETAFIYGSPTDTGRWWIAGGGLNPCAWDTDRDGLPDMWESQYRGVVYPAEDENGDDETIAIPRRLIYALEDFGYATNSSDIAKSCYGGMDGTVPDSFTGIEGGHGHNCDYDYDGLQNWQEYLTGTIRAFRYDDVTSPWQPYDTTALYAAIAAIVADTATYPQQTPPVKPSEADYDYDNSGLPLDTVPVPPATTSEAADYLAAVAAYTIAVGDYDNFTAAIAAAHDEWSKGLPASIGSLTDYPLNPIFRQVDFGTIEGAGINPNAIVGTFDWVAAYGSICRRAWDTSCGAVFFFPDGPNHALKRNTRISTDVWDEASGTLQNILRPVNAYERRILDTEAAMPTLAGISSLVIQQNGPNMYFGTSPIAEDSDNDGMDDYYELFHGLNPLYGGEGGSDLISTAWRSAATGQLREMTGLRDLDTVSAKNNFWTYWYKGTTIASDSDYYDFVSFPWMNGSMEADPDGDDLRNQYEAIQPNIQANRTYLHTDPTPLWMTDSSYDKSITSFCYRPIVSLLAAYVPADGSVDANLWGVVSGWNWSFEENEGFDTDTDWYSDLREGQKGADPQDADSPSRRQAMYFPGGTTFGAVQVQEDMMISVLNNIKDNVQQFATFTVECWAKADNPAGGKQVLVERMIQNRGSNLGDQWFLRRNFQLGIDAGGYWYAAFDHDGTGDTALQSVVATSSSPAGTKWTHLAATYDGTALRLYVDGQLATSAPTALKPATGVLATLTSLVYDTEHYPISTFVTLGEEIRSYAQATAPRRAIIMGAGVAAAAGVENISSMALDEYTDANDYAYYYAGYLDEVRLWDGARSATEIANSYQTRMTKDDIAANRDEIYDGLAAYQTRDVNGSGVAGELPAELLYHFSFDNIASAETDTSIAQGPFGMAATTADARYRPSVPLVWICPWWNDIGSAATVSAKSTVYGWDTTYNSWVPYSMVPWIQNTVAHLPAYDGTSRDTVYWKEDFAGRTSASSLGYSKLFFPRTTDPYNHIQTMENITTVQYSHRSDTTPYFYYQLDKAKDSQYYQLYQFTRRNDMLRNTDALPLGAAYAKYSSDMWDGQGATTTSEVTGADADNNGVADWADAVLGSAGKGMGDTITYGGLTDTVAHHLARLLAKGANLTNPTGDTTYKQVADFNSSGVPDWWEEMYSLAGNGLADDDNDGLSNYTEYLLSEVLNTGKVFNPTVARSLDAYTLDYFVKIGQLYTGEIFTDHDQMEDEWEDNYSRDYATRMEYDANLDNEGDGWSAASEARYGQMVRPITASAISHINNFGETIADHPVPTLALTVGYHDQAFNAVSAAGMVVYVKHVDSEADYDAKYVIPVDAETGTTTTNTLTQVLGRWSSRHAVGTLSPGHVKAGSIVLQCAYDPNAEVYSWRVYVQRSSSTGSYTYYRGSRTEYQADIRKYGLSNVELLGTTSSYEDIKGISFRYDEDTRTATMQHQNGAVIMGTINMETGEYDIDLGVFKGGTMTLGTNTASTVSSEDQTYRLVYEAASPGGIPRSLYLGQADVGAIKEGKNNVIVVADLDGDGLYTPGEPMGFVYGVEVGWKGGQADVTLTDTSPVSIRMNLVTGENDRDVVWAGSADIDKEDLDIVASASELGRYVRMRVVRAYANGADIPDAALQVPVIDRKVYLDSEIGKFLTEADFITAASPDVDWVNGAGLDVIDATNVQYRVMFGNADLTSNETIKPTAKYMFSRRFDANKYRAQVVTLAPGVNENYTVLDIRPTFKWRLDPVERDTYTAFRVVVTGTGFKYDSGVQLAPPRNAAGEYVWTAPICVSDQMAGAKFAGDTSTGVYANNATYNYTLYMYNAKFQSDAMGGTGTYYLSVPENSIATGNASIKVRYLGPAAAAAGKTIHLQAFTTPDFVGDPVASTYVAGNANIDTVNADFAANATLVGLDKGTYYLRAFIDSDDNGVCDAWESAGYLCGQGMAGVGSIYNPVGMNFSTEVLGSTAVREIYIEDADTNQNTVPDAWEYATRGAVDLPAATIAASITPQSDNIGITFNTDIGSKLLKQTTPGSVTEGMAGRVLLALNTPTVAALSMGYDTLEDAQAAVDTLDESASVVAITSLALDGTTATVGYTTDVNTVMSATAAKSAFYVTSGTTLSFQLVVKTKANLADEWTVADTRTVTVELGTEKSGEITVDVGALPEVAGFMTIELKK